MEKLEVVIYEGGLFLTDGRKLYPFPVGGGRGGGRRSSSSSSSGSQFPIVHYVYLVQDASDQARMGGVASNVYITAQAAYDAALALQASSGGIVVIRVGVTTATVVGGIVLSANMLSNTNATVKFEGLGNGMSNIGTITGDGFNISVRGNNMGFGSFTTGSSTGTNSGTVNIDCNNCTFGTIDTSAPTTRNAGSIIITGSVLTIGSVTASGGTTGNGANISVNCSTSTIGSITSNGGSIGNTNGGNITIQNSYPTGTITTGIETIGNDGGNSGSILIRYVRVSGLVRAQDGQQGAGTLNSVTITKSEISALLLDKYGTSTPVISVKDSVIDSFTQNNYSATDYGTVTFVNSRIGAYSRSASGAGLYGELKLDNNTEFNPGANIPPFTYDITGLTTADGQNMDPGSLIVGSMLFSSSNVAESLDSFINLPVNKVIRFYAQPGLDVTIVNGAAPDNPHTKTGANVVLTGTDYDWIELMNDSNTGNIIEVNSSLP